MSDAPAFDLQSHSLCSDGALAPTEVVEAAARAGVTLLALTDHDSVDGVEEALAAGRRLGVRLSPAAELSALDDDQEDLHVLGYELDHSDPVLLAALRRYRADRERRAERMAQALQEAGLAVDREGLEARRRAGSSIGRPHLAAAVLAHSDNGPRLAEEGLGEVGAVIEAYLVPGAPAYHGRSEPTVPEAIAAIHDAGGVAVWAHPFWDVEADEEALARLERFVTAGLDGVEAFYVTHTRAQTLLLADAARGLGLLTTGSTDFHGPDHVRFGGFRGFALHGCEPVLGPIGA